MLGLQELCDQNEVQVTLVIDECIENHDDVMKWKHFPVTGYLCGEFTGREAGDLRCYRAHYDVIVM